MREGGRATRPPPCETQPPIAVQEERLTISPRNRLGTVRLAIAHRESHWTGRVRWPILKRGAQRLRRSLGELVAIESIESFRILPNIGLLPG